ncbi:MAG: hypothetical protein JRG73_18570 [Deltaproteobacteria bacterium]|nr:hypothetical protein [Deltaproteobacteria bacterium]
MSQSIPIVLSKLRPVAFKQAPFARPRLFERLSNSLEGQLTLLLSPPGSGKSTLIHHFLSEKGIKFLWYELDSLDSDHLVFLNYLLLGLRRIFPDFLSQIGTIKYSHIKNSSFLVAAFIVEQLELLTREKMVIVLDNYERIENAAEVSNWLQSFLECLPEKIHIFLLSTRRPDLHLSRLRLLGKVEILDGQDLTFQLKESKEFFYTYLQKALGSNLLERIQQRTQGWATGLMIYLRSLQELGCQKAFTPSELSDVSETAFFEYFEENILSQQEGSIEDFLLKTSLFSTLTPLTCNRFLNMDEADRILTRLEENNLFISANKGDRETYHYHPIFRSFLQYKLKSTLHEHEVEILHNRLAKILKEYDKSEAALHFIHARKYAKAIPLIRDIAEELIERNQVDKLNSFLKMLPARAVRKDPYLTYYEARVLEHKGDLEKSIAAYNQAMATFEHQDKMTDKAICYDQLGLVKIHLDDYKQARGFIQNGVKLLEKQNIHQDISNKLISMYCRLSEVLVKLEEERKSFDYVQKAEQLYAHYWADTDRVTLDQCHALRHAVMGNLKSCIRYASNAASLARDLGLYSKIPVLYHYLAFSFFFLGNLKESFRFAGEGLEYAENYGVEGNITGITGMLLTDMAYGHSTVGDYDQAVNNFIKGITQLNKGHNLTGMFWNYHALYSTFMKMDDLGNSMRYLELLSDLAAKINFPIEMAMARMDRADFCSTKGEFNRVENLIRKGEGFLNRSCKKMSVSMAKLVAAKSLYKIDRKKWAENLVISSLDPSGENIYHYLIYNEKDWLVQFLHEIQPQHEELAPVLQQYQTTAASFPGSSEDKEVPKIVTVHQRKRLLDMRIYCLGPFRVFVEDEEIFLDRSRSRKAIRLLKYLFHRREQGYTPRDFYMEILWPEMNPEKSYPNFRVILSMLRKLLIGQGKRLQNFPNILTKGSGLRLSLGGNGWADIHEFLSEIKLAELKGYDKPEDALGHYLKAQRLYAGDYLAEDMYDDLFLIDREYYKNQYIKVLTRILDIYERQKNTFEAINYAYMILSLDPYCEEVYRKLMTFYAAMGKKQEVGTAYQICRKYIEEELGLNLSFETRDLYEKMRQV